MCFFWIVNLSTESESDLQSVVWWWWFVISLAENVQLETDGNCEEKMIALGRD